MVDYINKQEVLDLINEEKLLVSNNIDCQKVIKNLYSSVDNMLRADSIQPIEGHWKYIESYLSLDDGDTIVIWACSNCGESQTVAGDITKIFKYCPLCGAKMAGSDL